MIGVPPFVQNPLDNLDLKQEGQSLHAAARELFPLCRSITGEGLRQSLVLLQRSVPLTLREIPSGTPVLDWVVPHEWNIREAWIKNAGGEKVVDFARNNLHVMSYSTPIRQRMSWDELRPHLHSLPDAPDRVPYRTSYYQETWGFCLSHRQWMQLEGDEVEVCIDSTLQPGHLTYGEYYLPGTTDEEFLFSCHSCHPSLANDNLSGMVLAARLAALLKGRSLHYSYRFLWVPGTIGAITWLAQNEAHVARVKHGLVLSCLGDAGNFNYKLSRRGNAVIDRAVKLALRDAGVGFAVRDFVPYGYDERQYCSPGFNLPMGALTRTPNGEYPEYHTSDDNLDLITPHSLGESLAALLRVVEILESNRWFQNLFPKGEPQLGRRGLYGSMGGQKHIPQLQSAMLWVLNYSDGQHDLLWIAERSGLSFATIHAAATRLLEHGLLAPVTVP